MDPASSNVDIEGLNDACSFWSVAVEVKADGCRRWNCCEIGDVYDIGE